MIQSKPQNEIEAGIIAKALKEVSIGDTLTYEAINRLVGREVVKSSRWLLMRAQKDAEKETGTRFATVPKVGIRRLPAEEVHGIGANVRRRVHRAAKRGFSRLGDLKYNSISPEDQKRVDLERSVLGAIATVSAPSVTDKISIGTQTGPIPFAQLVERLAK